MDFTTSARKLGLRAAVLTAALMVLYASALAVGLSSLDSPDEPIADPIFSALEILILALMPAVVALMSAVHAWAPASRKVLSLAALVFMAFTAVLTSGVHFLILTVSRHPAFTHEPWNPWVLSFRWPSVAYAVDILAWDVFFPLSMFFAAPVFAGSRLAGGVRWAMLASGALATAGLAGVVVGDMRVRNIGILGYVVGFLAVVILLGVLFARTPPAEEAPARG